MIAVIDYDVGNLGAVVNMFHRLGVVARVTADAAEVDQASHVVLAGNGAFDAAVVGLERTGLLPLLEKKILGHGCPVLGICVGAQILGLASEEGKRRGLGWLDMEVRRLPNNLGLPIPHMGWNRTQVESEHPVITDPPDGLRFYFVHSYHMVPQERGNVMLSTEYGIPIVAGMAKANIVAVQFHPEKSHRFGKWLLANFAKMQAC